MSQAFTFQLGLKIQKINNITLKTYKIIVSIFFILDKDDRIRFFIKSFLLVNIKLDIVFGMLFLTMNNINIDFKALDL